MTEKEWEARIKAEVAQIGVATRRATHYALQYGSAQAPARFMCDDGNLWVSKGPSGGHSAASEIVVSAMGQALDAPVPEFCYLEVSKVLVMRTPELKQFGGGAPYKHGTWFGARYVEGVEDILAGGNILQDQKKSICLYTDLRENRRRYALLAFLYGWAGTWSDQQFIFDTHDPCHVHSVDHGHFFPGQNGWTADSLRNHTERARLEPMIVDQVKFTGTELHGAARQFGRVDREGVIGAAVARPLEAWGVTMEDRVALAQYLSRRGDELAEEVKAAYGI